LKNIDVKKITKSKVQTIRFNPFPGLRPFTVEESHLYFGRENQVDEILDKLKDNRFIAILGASGSGKSSLMYCGIIPSLEGGIIGGDSRRWRIIKTRPGETPIENLSKALNKNINYQSNVSNVEKNITESAVYATLRSNSYGLQHALEYLNISENENILLLVDQFEELFRFRNIHEQKEQALEFVQLLLNLVNAEHLPVYVVFTMRSDFVGECAQFPELADLINKSNYLIPQMTRSDLKQVINGPVAVANGQISSNLVNQLINDVGDNPDQLPILQHALMRTWDYWIKHNEDNSSIDITHYMAIGGMSKALSDHANEAFSELNPRGEIICELMFKLLTEKQSEERGIRRPAAILEIMKVADASFDELISVIDLFRMPGRAFLNSPSGTKLTEDSIIDISHESLMRIWDKLKVWVSDEADSAQMYLRLIEAAGKYNLGTGNLWLPPDLHIAVSWRDKQKPSEEWGNRYAQGYSSAIFFLETSEREFNAAEQNKLRQQKKALRRSRITAIILGIASIISLGFMLYAVTAQVEAEKQRLEAIKQTKIATENEKKATDALSFAQIKTKEAEEQRKIAEGEKRKADIERKKALDLYQIANEQRQIALNQTKEATRQKGIADSNATVATNQKLIAESESQKALRLRMISISQSMAIKSQQIDRDTTLQELLAFKSYNFNTKFNGESYNNDIYNALYSIYYKTTSNKYFDNSWHSEAVRSIVISNQSNTLYSASSDGTIFATDNYKAVDARNIFPGKNILRAMIITNDGKKIIALDNKNSLIAINTQNNTHLIHRMHFESKSSILGYDDYSNSIMFSNANKFYFIDFKKLKRTTSKNKETLILDTTITAYAKLENTLLIATASGEVFKSNFEGKHLTTPFLTFNSPISKIVIDRVQNQAILGDFNGSIYILDLKTNQVLYRINAHRARISDMKFNSNFSMLATASFDGSVMVWQTKNYDIQPIVLKDISEWIWSVAFSADNNFIYAGYTTGKIHRWPLNQKNMAEDIKNKIERNFTEKEWNRYIGSDIPAEQIVKKNE